MPTNIRSYSNQTLHWAYAHGCKSTNLNLNKSHNALKDRTMPWWIDTPFCRDHFPCFSPPRPSASGLFALRSLWHGAGPGWPPGGIWNLAVKNLELLFKLRNLVCLPNWFRFVTSRILWNCRYPGPTLFSATRWIHLGGRV